LLLLLLLLHVAALPGRPRLAGSHHSYPTSLQGLIDLHGLLRYPVCYMRHVLAQVILLHNCVDSPMA
jgi:hypothetical protein